MAIFSETKVLGQKQLTTLGSHVIYVTPNTSTFAIVNFINVANIDGASATYNLHLIQSGLSAVPENALIVGKSVSTNTVDTTIFTPGVGYVVRGNQNRLIATASRANALTITAFGVETTEI